MTNDDWLKGLSSTVHKRPIVLFRFSEEDWERISERKQWTGRFTFAANRESLRSVRVPTVCFLTTSESGVYRNVHIGLLESQAPITTIQSRLSISNAQSVEPSTEKGLLDLVDAKYLKHIFRSRVDSEHSVVKLSPTLSVYLIQELAQQKLNRPAMFDLAAALISPTTGSINRSVQRDAVSLALKAFGLSSAAPADQLQIEEKRDSVLEETHIREDLVIAHDARTIPGFSLSNSYLTGRAMFRKGGEMLEVITANRSPLEEVLGVDLIYLNAIKQNLVMIQYKMLEPEESGSATNWIYRPDQQLENQMKKMKLFNRSHSPQPFEFRLNSQVCYLRFVKRRVGLGKSPITIPIDHYENLRMDPASKGPRGAFRISYESLEGRYLRQEGFLDLLRSGYIGAYAQTTEDLTTIVNETLTGNRALIQAIHSSVP